MSEIKAVGFIGLGVMGEAMCRNLVRKCGKPVIGFDVRPEPLDRLSKDGVKRAASIPELMSQVDAVFVCVRSASARAD